MSRADSFRIDSHKLIFHPHRVAQWLDGKMIYPLYMEISPAGSCNHRCNFCAKDYLGYRPRFLDTDILLQRLTELGSLGVRSIMYGGEGEPLLHADMARIIKHTRSAGIDVAMSTNGVFLAPELGEQILPEMSWLKISVNAGTPGGYAAIHRAGEGDFEQVFANLSAAARFVDSNSCSCVLGTQAVLLPENAAEMELLAKRSKDAGASYLVIKPYSQHHKSLTRKYEELDYTPHLELQERLERFNDSSFTVVFRSRTMAKMKRAERGYGRCLALPFWSYIDAGGDVWGCSSYIGDAGFLYGNIQADTFRDIWEGEARLKSLQHAAEGLDPEECRMNCRMDDINIYLWELAHPGDHVNFI